MYIEANKQFIYAYIISNDSSPDRRITALYGHSKHVDKHRTCAIISNLH